jgi:hypothetical protein
MKPTNEQIHARATPHATPNTLRCNRRLRHNLAIWTGLLQRRPPIYAPTSIASPVSCPSTSARKPPGTPASGDAANGDSPARWASSISRSIAARVRTTTGCTRTSPLVIRAAGFERSSETSSPRSSGDVSGGRSTCERSSCRSRCHGSPLFIGDRRRQCRISANGKQG